MADFRSKLEQLGYETSVKDGICKAGNYMLSCEVPEGFENLEKASQGLCFMMIYNDITTEIKNEARKNEQ